jgi:hypothetical protein
MSNYIKTFYKAAGFLLLFVTTLVTAQVPQRINYQAVARDASGNELVNQQIGVRLSVLDGGPNAPSVFTETHQVTTNAFGLFTLQIGGGTTVSGSFGAIDWSTGSKFLQVEIDPNGGSNYTDLGAFELLSVPYAMYAAGGWSLRGNAGTISGTNFIGTTDNQALNFRVNNEKSGRIGLGDMSTFLGYQAGNNDNLMNGTTFIGYQAGFSNTTGFANTSIGNGALYSNTTGSYNTASGSNALSNNTTGSYNTASGYQALYSNTTGDNNTASGYRALYLNTTGFENTASGSNALYSNTEGSGNTASGAYALQSNTTGDDNTASGVNSLYSNTTGHDNTAIGRAALYYNTTGSYNTSCGRFALYDNSTQSNNTAVGYNAGSYYTFTQGTFLGSDAYPNNNNGYTNVMGLGYQARPTASNSVRVGNSSVTAIGGFANWTNVSDGRFKKNVSEDVKGLEFILKLRPVTYNLAVHDLAAYLKEDQKRDKEGNVITETDELDRKARDAKEKIRYTGFIAQEVEEAARAVGFDFSGVDAPDNENDLYGLRYAEFVVPLVKAVQELSSENAEFKTKLEMLQKQMDALNARLGQNAMK